MPVRAIVVRLAALAAVVGLAACGPAAVPSPTPTSVPPLASDTAPPAASEPGPSTTGTPVWLPEWADTSDVPDVVADRRALPVCGIEVAPAPQPGIFVDRAVRLCFWEARGAGREAEFVSLQSTMEGGRIATIYRLAADGTIEVLTDFTQDPFGGGAWHSQTCTDLVEATEGDELFSVDGCGEAQTLD
jgi:hypothetical protein